MAESHVVSALVNKRAEIAGMIARTERQLGQFRADLGPTVFCDALPTSRRLAPTSFVRMFPGSVSSGKTRHFILRPRPISPRNLECSFCCQSRQRLRAFD
jgi:hypothetical protein